MNQIQKRVERIEKKLKVSTEPETLQEQLRKFAKGDYGKHGMMSIAVCATHYGPAVAVKNFPEPLRSAFRGALTVAMEQTSFRTTDGSR